MTIYKWKNEKKFNGIIVIFTLHTLHIRHIYIYIIYTILTFQLLMNDKKKPFLSE